MIDISYPIQMNMAIYPENPAFGLRRTKSVASGDGVEISEVKFGTHTGTHIDAPSHFIEGGETLDEIELDRMNGKAKVFDVTGYEDIDVSFLERQDIGSRDIVLFKTNNSLRWACDTVLDDFVTLTYEGAEYLADRGIRLAGIDYLTIERPHGKRTTGKSVHRSLLGEGILICEGLRLREVTEGEYVFHCLPLKIVGADGCPVRAVLDNILVD